MLWPDGRFVSSNAGHNPPFLVSLDGSVRRFEKGGLPLGMFERAAYEEEEVTLAPGDTLLVFSDGLSEAANALDEEYGEDRLMASVAADHRLEPDALLELLLSRVRAFCRRLRPGGRYDRAGGRAFGASVLKHVGTEDLRR